MNIKVKIDDGAFMPVRAHLEDAGFDLKTPIPFELAKGESITIDTGVHFEIPKGYFGCIEPKSGLNTKYGVLTAGVIDSGYTGSVRVKLYRHDIKSKSIYKMQFAAGEKIAQIIFHKIPEVNLVESEEISGGERGDNGFGSTGRM